jgi:hypothetical protein
MSGLLAAAGCSKGANQGAEEARKQAEAEQKAKEARGEVAKKISPPVPGDAKLACANVLKPDLVKQVLGEAEDVTIVDAKGPAAEGDAAATCEIRRGGKRLTTKEQEAKLKKEPRLGVMAGDEICNIALFCSTIEDGERFKKRCLDSKDNKIDDTLGFSTCLRIIMTGANDVNSYRFFDDDTKCIFQVRAGASNVDNDLIGKCAKAAHDLIGPNEIKVTAAAPTEAPPAGSGEATK